MSNPGQRKNKLSESEKSVVFVKPECRSQRTAGQTNQHKMQPACHSIFESFHITAKTFQFWHLFNPHIYY